MPIGTAAAAYQTSSLLNIMTGMPIENHLESICAHFSFLNLLAPTEAAYCFAQSLISCLIFLLSPFSTGYPYIKRH
jgi:hypothetical protein